MTNKKEDEHKRIADEANKASQRENQYQTVKQ